MTTLPEIKYFSFRSDNLSDTSHQMEERKIHNSQPCQNERQNSSLTNLWQWKLRQNHDIATRELWYSNNRTLRWHRLQLSVDSQTQLKNLPETWLVHHLFLCHYYHHCGCCCCCVVVVVVEITCHAVRPHRQLHWLFRWMVTVWIPPHVDCWAIVQLTTGISYSSLQVIIIVCLFVCSFVRLFVCSFVSFVSFV